MREVSLARWTAAQEHELEFWRSWRKLDVYRDLNLERYWQGELAKFSADPEFFRNKVIADIGCGPFGVVHFLSQAKRRVRLDPLLDQYDERLAFGADDVSALAQGEELPLRSGSIDVAICFNALDHMRDPAAALREIKRTLRPGGHLLLMVHTFPSWTMPLLFIDRLHPHHWTEDTIRSAVSAEFELARAHSETRRFEVGDGLRQWLTNLKYVAANQVVKTTYLVGQKR